MANKDLILSELEMKLRQDPHNAGLRWQLIKTKYEAVEAGGQLLLGNANLPTIYEDADARKLMQDLSQEEKMKVLGQIRSLSETQEEYHKAENTDKAMDVYLAFDSAASEDSAIAEEVFKSLNSEGISVYYEPGMKLIGHPDAHRLFALEHAKLLILIGTAREHLLVMDTESAWRRYLNIMDRTMGKHLLPAYRGMRPEDFPDTLSKIQGIDMGRIGAVQAILVPRVKELLGINKQVVIVTGKDGKKVNISALLTRIQFFVEDKDFKTAKTMLNSFAKEHGTNYPEYKYLNLLTKYQVVDDIGLTLACKTNDSLLTDYLNSVDSDRRAELTSLFSKADILRQEKEDEKLVEQVRAAHADGDYKKVLDLVNSIKKMPKFSKYGEVEGFYNIASARIQNAALLKAYKELVGDGVDFYKRQLQKKYPEKYAMLNMQPKTAMKGPVLVWLAVVFMLFAYVYYITKVGNSTASNVWSVSFVASLIAMISWKMRKRNGLIKSILSVFLVYVVIPFAVFGTISNIRIDYNFVDKIHNAIISILAYPFHWKQYLSTISSDARSRFIYEDALTILISLPVQIHILIIGIRTFKNSFKSKREVSKFNDRLDHLKRVELPEFQRAEYQALVDNYKDAVGEAWIEPVSQWR